MAQNNSNTNKRDFKHLSETERGKIAAYLDIELSLREIGRRMNRHVSTISREKKRGSVKQIDTNRKSFITYFPDTGARVYKENRQHCGAHSTVMKAWDFIRYAEDKILNEAWSPDAVVGYAKRLDQFKESYIPSTKTLYNWIDQRKLSVINMDLAMKMRHSTKTKRTPKHKRILGKSIEERPESIETREEAGHWEIDTVIGNKSKDDALLTLIERKTRKEIIRRIPNKDATSVNQAMKTIVEDYQKEAGSIFKSITSDNGSEFGNLTAWGEANKIEIYFAHPYASWERGSNERHNGLIRRFIKKGQPIHTYTDERIEEVEDWMNTLPRKILDYKTPDEVFKEFMSLIA